MAAVKYKVKLRIIKKAKVKNKKGPKAKAVDGSIKNHKELIKIFTKGSTDSEQMWSRLSQEKMIDTASGSCNMCGYLSKKRSDVVRHVKCVHLKIRDFQCKICQHKCFGSSSLNMHIKSVHLKVKDFMCGLCGYLACRGADINKHLRHKHRLSNEDIEARHEEVVKKLEEPINISSPKTPPKTPPRTPRESKNKKTKILEDVTAKVSNPKVVKSRVKKKSKKPPKKDAKTEEAKKPEKSEPKREPSRREPIKREPAVKILVPHGRKIVKQTSAIDGMMCHVCKYSCDNRSKLMQHFERLHMRKSDSGLDFICAHCDYTSSLKVIIKSHIITHHATRK